MILGQGLAHYFSDVPDMKNHFPYKVCKITIYHNNDKVLGVKANYYSFKSMTTIKCKAHKFDICICKNCEIVVWCQEIQIEIGAQ